MTSVFGYGFWLLATHAYSTADIGTAAAVVALISLASIGAEVGLRYHIIQKLPGAVAEGSARTFIVSSVRLATATSVLAGVVAVGAGYLLEPHLRSLLGSVTGSTFVVVGVVLTTWGLVTDSVLLAMGASKWSLYRNASAGFAKVALLVVLAFGIARSAYPIIIATIAALGISLVMSSLVIARSPSWSGTASTSASMLGVLRQSIRQHLITIGGFIPIFLLPLEVVGRLSSRSNAYFSLTWALAAVTFMISPAISGALLADVSRGAALKVQIRRAATYIIGLVLVPVLVLGVFAPSILGVFGRSYAVHGSPLLRVLVISALPDAVTNLKVSVLRAGGRYRAASGLNTGMAVIAVIVAWVLLPDIGITACGVAWLVAQSTGSLWAVGDSLRRGEVGGIGARSRSQPAHRRGGPVSRQMPAGR